MSLHTGNRVWVWCDGVWRLGDVEGFAPYTVAIRLCVGRRLRYVELRDVDRLVRFRHPNAPPGELVENEPAPSIFPKGSAVGLP